MHGMRLFHFVRVPRIASLALAPTAAPAATNSAFAHSSTLSISPADMRSVPTFLTRFHTNAASSSSSATSCAYASVCVPISQHSNMHMSHSQSHSERQRHTHSGSSLTRQSQALVSWNGHSHHIHTNRCTNLLSLSHSPQKSYASNARSNSKEKEKEKVDSGVGVVSGVGGGVAGASSSVSVACGLYERLLFVSSQFSDYNFRKYFQRKSMYDFHSRFSAKSSDSAARIYIQFAERAIPQLERMSAVNRMYATEQNFIIEKMHRKSGEGSHSHSAQPEQQNIARIDAKVESSDQRQTATNSPSAAAKLFSESPLNHKLVN